MGLDAKPAPEFTRAFLIDLADGLVYRQAERLFETGAVRSVKWESPVLKGSVKGIEATYAPELSLRSTVFAVNQCNCEDGKRRKVCAHALAIAMHYEALKRERFHAAQAKEADEAEAAEVVETAAPAERNKLRSLKIDDAGDTLRLLVYLPPNFEDAVERDAIVIKFEAAVGREVLPLNRLSSSKQYKPASEAQLCALSLIETWCGGKLANLVQLTATRFKRLLVSLEGEPVIYWLKKPNSPIEWEGGSLSGVSECIDAIKAEAVDVETAEVVTIEEKPSFRKNISLREQSKPNLRRIAEAKAQDNWKYRKGDFPAVTPQVDAMEKYAQNRIIVDGSLNYMAIRLPADREDTSIAPLRSLLKIEGFLLEPSNRKWWLRDRHKTLNFLADHWQSLKDEWKAVFTENFLEKFAQVEFAELKVEVKETDGVFVLEAGIDAGEDDTDLHRAIATGRHYIDSEGPEGAPKLRLLNKATMDRLHTMERSVSGQADRPLTPTFRKTIDTKELLDTEELLEELSEGWQPPQAWQALSRALKQVGALEPAPMRAGLDSVLRTYQRIGVAWLWHLYRNDLGGILADEMGLGKTLQALALIECIRNEKADAGPALVVCPASLVENWAREASRFVPGLKVCRQHGPSRIKDAEALETYDIIVTSYGTLRQDSELLSSIDWSVVIGDEAQHIKNRRTQNAKSLVRMRSEGRFLLTGTPVENSLDDLLSLFAFLMPGYLSTAPSNLSMDDKAWHSQRQTSRAAAYILRRTKKEVAPELPDKIEKTFFCEFGSKQARFYKDTLEKTRRDIFNLEMSGAKEGKVRFAAFTELLRLRQACVDPRIIDETFAAKDSAKLQAFDEILEECLDSGSRILVFSSFVTALKLLAEHLDKSGHRYQYLDGQTKNRLAVCDTFNEDASIPVFLISLKAGGTGLNLTGADTVVHYDPWWNPAAEAQATDRAHRIGQKRVVTSIKLIATNTVEEKVLELQSKKAAILRELFEESESANAKVSLDDIRGLIA